MILSWQQDSNIPATAQSIQTAPLVAACHSLSSVVGTAYFKSTKS